MADFWDEEGSQNSPKAEESKPSTATPTQQATEAGNFLAAQTSSTSGSGSPVKSPEQSTADAIASLKERGKARIATEEARVKARTTSHDKEMSDSLSKMQTDAKNCVQKHIDDRKDQIKVAKKAHLDEQKHLKEKNVHLQDEGHLWEKVNALVDFSKPNKYAQKNTEKMRTLICHLKDHPNVKA